MWGIDGYVGVCVLLLSGAMVSLALFLAVFGPASTRYSRHFLNSGTCDVHQRKHTQRQRRHAGRRSIANRYLLGHRVEHIKARIEQFLWIGFDDLHRALDQIEHAAHVP
jgi:hypothetical protein